MIREKSLKEKLMVLSIIMTISFLSDVNLSSQDRISKKQPKKEARYFTLHLQNAEISELINIMSRIIGKNIIIDDRVKGKITILSAKRIPVEQAMSVLRSILEYKGLALIEEDNLLKIVPMEKAKKMNTDVIVKEEIKNHHPPND
jgi:general secretion pathway protein D